MCTGPPPVAPSRPRQWWPRTPRVTDSGDLERLAAAPLLPPPRTPPSPGLGRQAGLYVAARRPRPASTMRTRRGHVLPPQPPAKTHMFAPAPHAPRRRRTRMAREWGGLDRDVFSRAAAARCLGSSEGCPARPVVSLRVDGRPISRALRHRRVLERLWSKQGGRRPPWDLLRLPTPRRSPATPFGL